MFVKLESKDIAEALHDMGFHYTTETLNRKTFYCFEQSPELAGVILNKFANVRLFVDEYMRF